MRNLLTLLVGMLFGTGIAMSGMANPAKVINFFDVAGTWDPSLAFVMGGAVIVTFIGYRMVLRRPRPIYEPAFDIPKNRQLDARLLDTRVIIFVAALVAGMLITRVLLERAASRTRKGQPAG